MLLKIEKIKENQKYKRNHYFISFFTQRELPPLSYCINIFKTQILKLNLH